MGKEGLGSMEGLPKLNDSKEKDIAKSIDI